MTFIKGDLCELRVLERSDHEAATFTKAVNAGLTTKFLLTGSVPMRAIDIKEVWEREAKAGSVEFGIWAIKKQHEHEGGIACGKNCAGDGEASFIGTCGLFSHRDIYRSWEFRILIFDPSAIGHGIGTEATRMTVRYAFERMNAHRVWLGVHAENLGAIKCYEKCGFVREGVLREELFTFGKYADAVRYGLLEQEWKSSSQATA